ncbi:MAG: SDR family NAD(P)-dependent oxidoreductase [Myxococcota bacterium]
MTTEAPFTPIAVVGAGALFPGSHDTTGFWQNILAKKDLIREIPAGHWLISDYYDADPKAPDKTYAKRGAFLDEVPFDAMGFGIPPSILPATDTSQLLALIVAQAVLDDVSGFKTAAMDTSRVSVILGVTGAQELLSSLVSRLQRPVWERSLRGMGMAEADVKEACDRIASHYVGWQESSFPGLLGNVVAGRIANRLNLGGTNCITDAACASALAAVHLAINELRLGQSDMVVTGGVDTLNDIFMYMCFSKTPALSPSGDCRPFDEAGDGTLLGEGLGMMALKRLADAERDGDQIYAVIKGIGTSSDGKSKSVYAPVPEGQARALRKAYEVAGYGPETVDLVEAHGTATKAGDAAEIKGLKMVFEESGRKDRQWCALGSIKSQIGHTKAAAGAAGLLKVVMALHHKVLPPTIKVTKPTPAADFPNSPFYVNTEARPWIHGKAHPRRASVSSFGFGGSNFHMTCEEYVGSARRPLRADLPTAELLVFSADTAAALVAKLEAARGQPLIQLAYECQKAFDAKQPFRIALVVEEPIDPILDRAIATVREGKPIHRAHVYFHPGFDKGQVAFLFPGQGSQYIDMGKDLAMRFDAARAAYDDAEAAVPGLANVLFPRPTFTKEDRARDEALLVRTEWAQPAIGATSSAMVAMLAVCGLRPDATAGHSFGELTALWAAGSMAFGDWMTAARTRGVLMAGASETPGAMAAVTGTAADVTPHLVDGVNIANLNAPEQTVIAGTIEGVDAVIARCKTAGLRATRLAVATAFHSPIVAPAAEAFAAHLRGVEFTAPNVPVWSNTTAATLAPSGLAEALGAHLAKPVRFVEQVEAMYVSGVRTFIEVGPGGVLSGLVTRILGDRPHEAFSVDQKGRSGVDALLAALGRAAALGLPVRFEPLWAQRDANPLKAPAPKMAVQINGSNYGKPYPTPSGGGPTLPSHTLHTPARKEDALVKTGVHTHPLPTPSATGAVVAASRPVAPPVTEVHATPVATPAPAPAQSWGPNPWVAAFQDSQRQMADVQESFTRSMSEAHIAFLRSHEESTRALVSLVTGAPLAAAQPWAPTLAAPVYAAPALPAPVYAAPAPVYAAPAAPPPVYAAPAPVYAAPAAPAPVYAAPAPVAPVRAAPVAPVAAAPAVDLTKVLLEVVAEKTGYPTEMLNLEMNLEADLGIDSIKRVEILSALREKAPETPEVDADRMAALKTLGQIVAFLGESAPKGSAAPVAAPVAAKPSGADPTKLLLEVVAEKTGYPVEMLNLGMNLEADLGIDSIKRVEILSALRERAPETPEVDADRMAALKTLGQIVSFLGETMPTSAAPAASATSAAPTMDATRLLLEVVGEKTGYPVEMLNLDMNLEADLGIDSIKRVEILSALRERAPETPEVDADRMAALKTLGQIVAFLGESAPAVGGTPLPFDGGGARALTLPPALRQEVFVTPIAAGSAVKVGPLALVPDDRGVAALLAARLVARGVDAVVRSFDQLDGTRGVVFLGALSNVPDVTTAVAVSKAAFRAAKKAALGTAWVTVTATGGDFGLAGVDRTHAVLAGLAGFTKTAALEHPASFVRAIDLSAEADPATLAAWIDAELGQSGPVEVGVTRAGRVTLEARDVDIAQVAPAFGPSDVFVVSGGARGVTAACLLTLARSCRPKFVLLGRSRIDAPEAPAVAAAVDENAIKKAIFSTEKGLTPPELGRRAAAVVGAREARATIAALEAAGSTVRYLAVDVQDGAALEAAFTKVRKDLGPITGLVHGAGVIQDKRIAEKPDASFDAVYDTKIGGMFALFAATSNDPLKAICLFSSVAARGGNVGQCDYAMANEAMNKVAAGEAKRRPGCVVKSIGWGPWAGGMVTPALAKQFAAMGVPLLPIDVGAQMFVAELAAPGAVEIVVGGMIQPAGGAKAKPTQTPTAKAPSAPAVAARAAGSASGTSATAASASGTVTRVVQAKDYPFLRDHAIAGSPVFPVVLALEWFVQLAQELRPGMVAVACRDLKVLKGITLPAFEGVGNAFEVRATEAAPNQLAMEIKTAGGPAHYRATVELAARTPARPAAPSPAALGAYDHALGEVYGSFLFHGPGFQVIRAITGASKAGMEATLTGTHDIGWPVNGWKTDLAAFDGGLQLALLWNRIHTDAAALPTGIGAWLSYGAPAAGVVRCVLTGRKTNGRSVSSDIAFVDSAGTVFAELRGVETHALPSGAFPVSPRPEA